MSSTSFPDEDESAVVVAAPVGIVGNSERSGELSTSPQA
jgi:precorrin isomerase